MSTRRKTESDIISETFERLFEKNGLKLSFEILNRWKNDDEILLHMTKDDYSSVFFMTRDKDKYTDKHKAVNMYLKTDSGIKQKSPKLKNEIIKCLMRNDLIIGGTKKGEYAKNVIVDIPKAKTFDELMIRMDLNCV